MIKAKRKKKAQYRPKLLISVHGIRTDGAWQKHVGAVFSPPIARIEAFDYGRYGLMKFLRPSKNRKMVDQFYNWYANVTKTTPGIDLNSFNKRPSCVAHSFGTWIVGMAMIKHPDVKFDKLVFTGSVLPADFDWDSVLARDQVGRVYNECGGKDVWPGIASWLVSRTGPAGSRGFNWHSSVVTDHRRPEFAHSDSLYRQHMEAMWKPFVLSPPSPLYILYGKSVDTEKAFRDILNYTGGVIDKQAYGAIGIYNQLAIPRGLSMTWTTVNPDIYTFLVDKSSGTPAGYVNAMPVTDQAYAKLRAGTLCDRDLRAEDIVPFQKSGKIKIYLMSVAILKKHRVWGQGLFHQAFVKLLAATVDKLVYYAQELDVVVTHFLAITWTPEGRKMCELLGMQKVGVDASGHDIFELEVAALVKDWKSQARPSLRRLIDAYRAR